PPELGAALGVLPGTARQIMRGQRPLTDEESDRLRAFIPGFAGGVHVDPDIAWAVDRPEVRPLWESAAQAAGTHDSAEFRWQFYSSGQFALAARTTGTRSARERALEIVKGVLGGRA